MLYTELLEKIKAKLNNDVNVSASDLRRTIIDLIPANPFEMIDIAVSGNIYEDVEAYGVSIEQVCRWALIEQLEQDYPFPEDFDFKVGDHVRALVDMPLLDDDFNPIVIFPGDLGKIIEVLAQDDQPYGVRWTGKNTFNHVDEDEIERA